MKLIRGLHNFTKPLAGSVVTIGNFDGLHLGHQRLIETLLKEAKALQLPSVLFTFEPQPNEFFSHDKHVLRLMRLREKVIGLQDLGLDYVLCVKFNKAFASVSAEDFVQHLLVEKLNAKAVVVGDDFRFGQKRVGDFALLESMGEQCGFSATQISTYCVDQQRVSSSRVREALLNDDLASVEHLLGRRFSLWGTVVHGDKRGRELGYPTANMKLHRPVVPMSGIFAVRVMGLSGKPLDAVASLGSRPMFDGDDVLLEVFIFDFDQEIYGHCIGVEFVKKLRDEEKFASIEALKVQMAQDVEQAKGCLA